MLPAPAGPLSLPRELVEIAERVICHRDAEVPARLYRIIWRAARDRHLLARTTDPEVDWLRRADKAIRRDVHKMHAFVRFRPLGGEENGRAHVTPVTNAQLASSLLLVKKTTTKTKK